MSAAPAAVDPRVARTRQVVLAAAGELLAECGMAGFSVDAVSRRSGVARTTIYRHWPEPEQLVFDGFASLKEAVDHVVTGDLRTDLVAYYRHLADALVATAWGRMLPVMLDATFRNPDLRPLHRDFIAERRRPVLELLAAAVDRGDLPAGTDLGALVDRVAGPIFYRYLVVQDPMDPAAVAALVDDVLAGVSPTPSPPAR